MASAAIGRQRQATRNIIGHFGEVVSFQRFDPEPDFADNDTVWNATGDPLLAAMARHRAESRREPCACNAPALWAGAFFF